MAEREREKENINIYGGGLFSCIRKRGSIYLVSVTLCQLEADISTFVLPHFPNPAQISWSVTINTALLSPSGWLTPALF